MGWLARSWPCSIRILTRRITSAAPSDTTPRLVPSSRLTVGEEWRMVAGLTTRCLRFRRAAPAVPSDVVDSSKML